MLLDMLVMMLWLVPPPLVVTVAAMGVAVCAATLPCDSPFEIVARDRGLHFFPTAVCGPPLVHRHSFTR